MSNKKAKQYHDYTKPELDDAVRQLEEELFRLRFQAKASKLDKPHKIGIVRRDIGRVKTFLRLLALRERRPAPMAGKG